VSTLNGGNGFELVGSADSDFGSSVASVGDINNDGRVDLIVGAPGADGLPSVGTAYVIYGQSTFPRTLNTSTLNGTNGFKLIGPVDNNFGWSVASAGDINDDGRVDLMVGTSRGEVANAVYVVFGQK